MAASFDGVAACGGNWTGGTVKYNGVVFEKAKSGVKTWQCTELAARWFYADTGLVVARLVGAGRDVAADFHKQHTQYAVYPASGGTATFSPAIRPGDIISMWGPSNSDRFGHAAIVTKVSVTGGQGSIRLLDENDLSSGIAYINVHDGHMSFGTKGSYYYYNSFQWLSMAPQQQTLPTPPPIPAPCTPAALTTALDAQTNQPGGWKVRSFACQSGYSFASIKPVIPGMQDVAILQQRKSAWKVLYVGEGLCLPPGQNQSVCKGYKQPMPIALLESLMRQASVAAVRAELYINTVFTPGTLYKYPTGPATIGLDNHDYIRGLRWVPGSQGDLIGTGTLHWDDCTPDCASGTYHTVLLQITASNPKQCTAKLYPQGYGNATKTVQAEAFDAINVTAFQGNLPSSMNFSAMLTGLTCTQSSG